MQKIGYLYDPFFMLHDTGPGHIEIPRRVEAIDELISAKYDTLPIPSRMGNKEELLMVHDDEYVEWIEHGYENGVRMIISADTIVSEMSYEVALKAATSTKNAVKFFKEGLGKRAFLNLRPPGHHAEVITGQGFCIFNNIAMMARYAQQAGYAKVIIIDFDVHHGNGTQDIFYEDPTVFYFSTHEKNNYPYFTGSEDETGRGAGLGYTRNFPYHDYLQDHELLAFYDQLPKNFDFDIVLVSAGYDLMKDELISTAQITFEGIGGVVQKILDYAGDKPVAFLLEGGYNIDSLVQSVDVTMQKLQS